MEIILPLALVTALVLSLVFVLGPRPTLNPAPPDTQTPPGLSPAALEQWLAGRERAHGDIIEGAEACIHWAGDREVADLCLLYVHGFSATRQETAPVTERIAAQLGANVVYTRLAGHGLSRGAMAATAEDWLQSMVDAWEIASRLGRRVIIIAVSTGAPLTVWLHEHINGRGKAHGLIFLSPNFRIRNPLGFLLTWPWAETWLPRLAGRERAWEPENEMAARYWTHRYSTRAVIEMQKVVDWARRAGRTGGAPLATLYMEGDPVIDHRAAVSFHERWPAAVKALHRVDMDAGNPQHVFAGAIMAPHRIDWTVERCVGFIRAIPDRDGPGGG